MKLMSLHKVPGFLPITFAGNKKPIVSAFFSADSKRIFTVAQNGMVLLWKWESTKSEASAKIQEFAEFKMGKKLKVGGGEKKLNAKDVTEEDQELMTDLEREAANGRYLLEKRSRF